MLFNYLNLLKDKYVFWEKRDLTNWVSGDTHVHICVLGLVAMTPAQEVAKNCTGRSVSLRFLAKQINNI